ncbi:MAG: sulfatase-like hydrolase/transferase [Candidatus Thermoplasmatota archaeon]|nr:sulfatase-like hydrolase/transferase [Candidatus Thermoplasmatota archaeon]MCL5789205.1 sulfatase-like hydrolase/transferase [Candidatus Thermoplasmatota archaeon]
MKSNPNVILILLDTLRKDVLPMYGGSANAPHLTNFAKDAIVFPNAIAPSPWTVVSHVSMFSGLYPSEHGVDHFLTGSDFSKVDIRPLFEKYRNFDKMTIIQRLRRTGYNTVGITANPFLYTGTGLEKDFTILTYKDPFITEEEVLLREKADGYGKTNRERAVNLIRAHEMNLLFSYLRLHNKLYPLFPHYVHKRSQEIVSDVINSHIRQPIFLFLNFMDVHEPLTSWEYKNYVKIKEDTLLKGYKIPEHIASVNRRNDFKAVHNMDISLGRLLGA